MVKSSIVATLGHCLTQAMILLIFVTRTQTINDNDNPPIFHCYLDVDHIINTTSTFSRCLIMGGQPTNCTDGMLHSDGDKKYVTFCHGIELWLPLVVTCTTIIIALLLTVPLTFWLNNLLDPVKLTMISKRFLGCCLRNPNSYLPPIWNGDVELAMHTLHLLQFDGAYMQNKEIGRTGRTGREITYWLVENDCHELLHDLFTNQKLPVDKALLTRACRSWHGKTEGSPKTMRLLLMRLIQDMETSESEERGRGFDVLFQDQREVETFKQKLKKANEAKTKWFRKRRQHKLLINILIDTGMIKRRFVKKRTLVTNLGRLARE